jgi:peptidoglycan hydrolase-like protein with peptidoglycan-binding domain
MLAAMFVLAAVGSAAGVSRDAPLLVEGDRGANVRALQHLLRHRGAKLSVDGVFGTTTASAVRLVQRRASLVMTGRVDRRTWSALLVPLRAGSAGEAVLAVQRLLNEKRRAGLTLTGAYDAATRSAVAAFQGHAGLSRTGETGTTTWRLLLAHLELPVWGTSLCDYSVGNGAANWGVAEAIGALEAAARAVAPTGHGRIPVGDIGLEHGGDIAGHQTHEEGLDVDLRPMRVAKDQCRWGTNWRAASYDRAATRDVIASIRAAAPGRIKLIYFNDPVLVREGLTIPFSGHDDHLHVRYCRPEHPVVRYAC